MKKLTLILALCACGGGSSKPASEPTKVVDPVPMTEPTATPTPAPTEPTTPAQPTTPEPKADPKAELLAAEMSAFEKAKPVFDKYCAKCHSKDGSKQSVGKRKHFDMTTYPFGGHHAMDVHDEVREVLGLTGKKPTMPADRKGAVQGAELDLIKAWADAFEASHEGGAHAGHDQHGGGDKH